MDRSTSEVIGYVGSTIYVFDIISPCIFGLVFLLLVSVVYNCC
jgi:hypothetical protein